MKKHIQLGGMAFLFSFAASTSAQTVPAVWNHCTEFVFPPGSAAGTTQGNPGPDSLGNLVWFHEYVTTGGALGSANPWYDEPASLLVWDPSWFGSTGKWVVGNDFGTEIGAAGATHIYGCSSLGCWFSYCPVRRWENLTGQALSLDVRGAPRIEWSGINNVAGPVDVDMVVALRPAGSSMSTILVSTTVSKPTPGSSSNEYLTVPVDLQGIVVAPGDSIVIAHRARNGVTQNRWITLVDDLLFLRSSELVGSAFCPGDGSGTVCPCGNSGSMHEGCASSRVRGAELYALGTSSTASDDLVLSCVGLTRNQSALLFVGTSQPGAGAGLTFGDGLRCVGGTVVRLGIQSTDGCGALTWGGGLLAQTSFAPGDTSYFQVWYRDPAGGPCGTGYNLSNGIEVTLIP